MTDSRKMKKDGSKVMDKPRAAVGDVARTLAKAGISAIPVVGGPLAELFSGVIGPPLVKRFGKWVESIAERLKKLEEKVDGFSFEALSGNDLFITTVMHATQVAIRSHQEEKLEALRNAALNSALQGAPEEDLQLMFLSFVDDFTPWHLKILKFLDDPEEWGRRNNIKYPNWVAAPPSAVLEAAFKELKGRRDFYEQVVRDLFARGLVNLESLNVLTDTRQLLFSRTTPMGKRFIKFIESVSEG